MSLAYKTKVLSMNLLHIHLNPKRASLSAASY